MTKDKTVTMSRELLDRVIARLDDDGWYGLTDELRAVLAQEECDNCDGTGGVKKLGGSDSCPVCKGSGVSASCSPPAPVSAKVVELLRRVVASGALTFDSQPDFESLEADIRSCLDKVKELNQ